MRSELAELEEFRDKIEAEFGLVFDQGRREQVEEALVARCSALGLSRRNYLHHLDSSHSEWEQVAALLTIPESYFFRHADHLRAFVETVVPELMQAHPGDRVLRILSVGCAGGEEPYTLAMTLLEHASLVRGWGFTIRGCDINPEALKRARRGVYTNWALRATPPACRRRYFTAVGNRHRILDEVKSSVVFDDCNALHIYRPGAAGSLDVIFFRNVLIYFSPEAIRAAISAVAHLLAPGGYLFLGSAETLRGVSDDFILCHTHEAFYYRRKSSIGSLIPYSPFRRTLAVHDGFGAVPNAACPDADSAAVLADLALHDPALSDPALSSPVLPLGTVWMQEIERSTERVRGLHASTNSPRRPKSPPARHGGPRVRTAAEVIQHLLSLLIAESYPDILTEVAALPEDLQKDPDVQVVLALAHLNRREIAGADCVCRTLLERDSMNSSGHYILALCREQLRDLPGAAEHDRIAIYLDPSFAMPHMHLALLARRSGDPRTARREFENANLLLARESTSRLTMFGGGFSREALRNLCRRELRALGAA